MEDDRLENRVSRILVDQQDPEKLACTTCEHVHKLVSVSNSKDEKICSGCSCDIFVPMDNLEYVAWKDRQKKAKI